MNRSIAQLLAFIAGADNDDDPEWEDISDDHNEDESDDEDEENTDSEAVALEHIQESEPEVQAPSRTTQAHRSLQTQQQSAIQDHILATEFSATTLTKTPFRSSYEPRTQTAQALDLLRQRETCGRLLPREKVSLAHRFIPNRQVQRLGPFHKSVFCGSFSKDGEVYMSASQDSMIRFYDCLNDFSFNKEIDARQVGWSIIDTDFSPDQKFLIYSSWSNFVHLVNVFKATGSDVHLALDFRPENRSSVCFFSIKFSSDSREIIAGSSDHALYVYDVPRQQRVLMIPGHHEDVNTVAWADDSSQILLSGSDDTLCKVWDRRNLSGNRPVGVFSGHHEGITHISPKGDGRYLISNSKDQSIKLWDIRKMTPPSFLSQDATSNSRIDYRFRGPHRARIETPAFRKPNDTSLQTYFGHQVYETLIRAKFSPKHTTSQRYIYSGSYDGAVFIWDVLTGEVVSRLHNHKATVRDVSWHPDLPLLCSASWDGTVGVWEWRDEDDTSSLPPPEFPRRRVIHL